MTKMHLERSFAIRAVAGWLIALALALASPARAETPVAYAVTYIELRAAAVPDGRQALQRYAVESRKEAGNLSLDILQEDGRQSRFAILEAWKSRDALDRHYRNQNTARLLSRLSDMRSAPDDRRMYAGLYASLPGGRAPAGSVYVMTHVDVMPPWADPCAALLKAMRAETPSDHGNIAYNVLRQEHEPNHFTLAEIWASKRDFEAHVGAAHTVSFRQKLLPMTGALYDERLFTEIE